MPDHVFRPSRRRFLKGAAAMGSLLLVSPALALAGDGFYQQTALFMGTIVRIHVYGCPAGLAEQACAEAFAEGRRLEALLTRHASDSPLGVLNAQGSLRDVPAPLAEVLTMSGGIHALSSGAFDPTVLPVLELLESTAGGARPSAQEFARRREKVGFGKIGMGSGIRLQSGMSITLDGIAKGYVAQKMGDALLARGCADYLVNAGGDIIAHGRAAGGRPWQVAIEDPAHGRSYPAVIGLKGGALATSGVYEKPFALDNGSHLIDPYGPAATEAVSVSVLADDGARADALATAFSVMRPADALALARRLEGIEAYFVLRGGVAKKTAGWPA